MCYMVYSVVTVYIMLPGYLWPPFIIVFDMVNLFISHCFMGRTQFIWYKILCPCAATYVIMCVFAVDIDVDTPLSIVNT